MMLQFDATAYDTSSCEMWLQYDTVVFDWCVDPVLCLPPLTCRISNLSIELSSVLL